MTEAAGSRFLLFCERPKPGIDDFDVDLGADDSRASLSEAHFGFHQLALEGFKVLDGGRDAGLCVAAGVSGVPLFMMFCVGYEYAGQPCANRQCGLKRIGCAWHASTATGNAGACRPADKGAH